ncbi:RICIN domain-containing protein (plasmid) [Ralstonia sp. 25C]|uniref:RICIN domain-containing protein n=1 Tax=Ralstonia sp. 25C TaxID=3447363 RepID=UPI003F74E9C9
MDLQLILDASPNEGSAEINLDLERGETMPATPCTIYFAGKQQFAIGVKDRIVNASVVLRDTTTTKEEFYQWILQDDNTIALRADPTLILDVATLADFQQFYLSLYNPSKVLPTQKWIDDGSKHYRNEGNPNVAIDNKGRATKDGNPIIVHAYNASPAQEWITKDDMQLKPTRFYMGQSNFAFGVKRAISGAQVVLLDTRRANKDQYEWIQQEDNTFLLTAGGGVLVLDVAKLVPQQNFFVSVYDPNNVTKTQQWMYDDNSYIRSVSQPNLVVDDKASMVTDGNVVWTYGFNGSSAQQWRPVYDDSLEKSAEEGQTQVV